MNSPARYAKKPLSAVAGSELTETGAASPQRVQRLASAIEALNIDIQRNPVIDTARLFAVFAEMRATIPN